MSESELEGFEGLLPLPRSQGSIERPRRSEFELTASEKVIARKNRRWMLTIVLPTLIIGAFGTFVTLRQSQSGHQVGKPVVPAGYKATGDNYFSYSVPETWKINDLFSDYAGDLYSGSVAGFAAENLGSRSSAPVPQESRPESIESFGMPKPTPYTLSAATPFPLQGAVAYRYTLSRPGFRATLIDAWQSSSEAEIWLEIQGTQATTAQILSTLRT